MLPVLPADKVLVRQYRQKIEGKFNQYKDRNPRMALYFTDINKPFIAFGKSINGFPQEIKWRRHKMRYIGQYDTAKPAGPQTDAILDAPEK